MNLFLKNLPQKPGVYIMKSSSGKILYIGKAKNIKKRVLQYFPIHKHFISQITKIDTILVKTEKEALLLENTLIKKHKPKYNILLKDDKTYVSLVITKEIWPKVQIKRFKEKKEGLHTFGPYTDTKSARNALDIIQKIFLLRRCSNREFKNRKRPCILYDIKRCLAPCIPLCSKEEYQEQVSLAKDFLLGKDKKLLKEIEKKMKLASQKLLFEQADNYLKILKKIQHIHEIQRVENLKTQQADAIGFYKEKNDLVITKLIFRNYHLTGSSHFSFSNILSSKETILENFLLQHYKNSPKLLLIPFDLPNKKYLEDLLKTKIFFPKKAEKKDLIDLAQNNAKSYFQKNIRSQEAVLLHLKEALFLENYPRHIQCLDISSLMEKNRTCSLVVFINGKRDPSKTKIFTIKTFKAGDIYAMQEVLFRHFKKMKEKNIFPDLIFLDGGRQHLNIAVKTAKELSIATVDIASIAKNRKEKTEKIFIPSKKAPILLKPHSPEMFLVQKIRDASHTVAISFHKKLRKKEFSKSILDNIKNIGVLKKKNLLEKFKSIAKIKEASIEELEKVNAITKKDAKNIYFYFKKS